MKLIPRAFPPVSLLLILVFHLLLLLLTKFTDWPEMIVYPWFVKEGLQLYKDIYIAYPPVSVVLGFLWFSAIGFTITSYKILTYLIILVSDVLLFYVGKKIWNNTIAYLVLFLFAFLQVVYEGNSLWHELMFVPIVLIAYAFITKYLEKKSTTYVVWTSCLFALGFLIKQTFIWIILSVGVTLGILHCTKKLFSLRQIVLFFCIPLFSFLGMIGLFWFLGAGKEYFYWVIQYPLSLTSGSSYTYLPSWKLMVQVFSSYIYIVGIIPLLFSRNVTDKDKYLISIALSFSLGLVLLCFPRWGIFRFQPSLVFVTIAIGFILKYILLYWQSLQTRLVLVYTTGIVCFLTFYYLLAFFTKHNPESKPFLTGNHKELSAKIANIVQNKSVYFWGDRDYYYFLINRKPTVIPWTHHFPWMLKSASLYEPIIERIEANKVTYMVVSDPNTPTVVSRYLQSLYDPITLVGESVVIFQRRK